MQALKRFRAGHDGLATFLTPLFTNRGPDDDELFQRLFNVHTEIKLILILILTASLGPTIKVQQTGHLHGREVLSCYPSMTGEPYA